ncbi:MAG: CapA family protein [Leptonema sp. (in: bacteria)]
MKLIIKSTSIFLIIVLFLVSVGLSSERNQNFFLPKDSIKLLFGGDTHFVWGVQDVQKQEISPLLLERILPLLESVDFRALNIETTFTEDSKSLLGRTYVFNSSPKNLEILKKIKLNLGFLANNHTYDYGEKGLLDTIENFKKYDIATIGAGANIEEALKPFLITIGGIRFAFFAISTISGSKNDYADMNKPGIAGYNERFIKDIKAVRSKVDYLFLSIHWGQEYRPIVSESQRNMAKLLLNNGVNFIIGHHPHIPQAIDVKNDSAIIYSLGNFLFGSTNYFQNHNILTTFHFDSKSKKFLGVEVIPITGKNRKSKFNIEILDKEESLKFFQEIYVLSIKENINQKIYVTKEINRLFFSALD